MALETVSIIVLTYNRKQLLQDCLDSLLRQTTSGDGLEVLIADDGSNDGTGDLVARYSARHESIKWLHHEHQGISATRNMGIRAAKGEIIAIVADDYILDRDYVKTILSFFRRRPDASIVRFKIVASRNDFGSRVSHFYYDVSMRRRLHNREREAMERWRGRNSPFRRIPVQNEVITAEHGLEASGAAAFRRGVFDQVGLFDESLGRGEDTELTLRLRSLGIQVYYYPHHAVAHQYERLMLDTIRKSFETGWSRYSFLRKHRVRPILATSGLHTSLVIKFETLINALRKLETPGQRLTYAPFLVVFEGVNKLGFVSSWIWSNVGFKSRRRPGRS